eukprot:2398092-Prymnesium_polylepis.1
MATSPATTRPRVPSRTKAAAGASACELRGGRPHARAHCTGAYRTSVCSLASRGVPFVQRREVLGFGKVKSCTSDGCFIECGVSVWSGHGCAKAKCRPRAGCCLAVGFMGQVWLWVFGP